MQTINLRSAIRFLISELDKGHWTRVSMPDDKSDMSSWDSPVQDMIDLSYGKIGGHPDLKQLGDARKNYPVWDVIDVDSDPYPDAIIAWAQKPTGLKRGASATDGGADAKDALKSFAPKVQARPGHWAEVSGASAAIALKDPSVPVITDERRVRKLLNGKEITWVGEPPTDSQFAKYRGQGKDGWYIRNIGGHDHMKIIVGVPND